MLICFSVYAYMLQCICLYDFLFCAYMLSLGGIGVYAYVPPYISGIWMIVAQARITSVALRRILETSASHGSRLCTAQALANTEGRPRQNIICLLCFAERHIRGHSFLLVSKILQD